MNWLLQTKNCKVRNSNNPAPFLASSVCNQHANIRHGDGLLARYSLSHTMHKNDTSSQLVATATCRGRSYSLHSRDQDPSDKSLVSSRSLSKHNVHYHWAHGSNSTTFCLPCSTLSRILSTSTFWAGLRDCGNVPSCQSRIFSFLSQVLVSNDLCDCPDVVTTLLVGHHCLCRTVGETSRYIKSS